MHGEIFDGYNNWNCIAKCIVYECANVGGIKTMKEKELKLILEGISTVATMLKLIIQHRGQVRKEKKGV